MKSVSLFNTAAIVAALTVPALAFILAPEPPWSSITIVTAIGFAGATGFVFYIPSILSKKRQDTDAQRMAAIGPLGIIGLLLLLTTGCGFALALGGHPKLALAMLVFGIGTFLVASLALNAALKVAGDVSAKGSPPSHHVEWQGRIAVLAAQAAHRESLAKLRALGEKLRFAASDVPGGSPQDASMEQAFAAMSAQLQSDPAADLTSRFDEIDTLLAQRDVFLRAARGKAR